MGEGGTPRRRMRMRKVGGHAKHEFISLYYLNKKYMLMRKQYRTYEYINGYIFKTTTTNYNMLF